MATGGSTETEIKLKIDDPGAIQEHLEAQGLRIVRSRVFETNTLYDFPDARLRAHRSILRLRQVDGKAILTFKGPAEAAKHKTREELETALGDAEIGRKILEKIGMQPGFRYDKYRTEFEKPGESGVVTVDETPVGWFLELEGQPEWIDRTASALGFDERAYITESYGSLYVKHCRENGLEPAIMVFGETLK
ncbi:MAG TPA: class IV adenylate cyclase [Bryobacteraceae bacterium]|nr:class IV adenylate cyclase [Bryobacteraceae bacterium]